MPFTAENEKKKWTFILGRNTKVTW